MEQLKTILAVCKKQHFWILIGLAALIPIIVYFVSGAKLQKATTDRMTEIKGASSGLAPLLGGDPHPNNDWIEKIHQISNDVRRQVYDSWNRLYQEQVAKVYLWPPELKGFDKAFSRPIGTFSADDTQELRERYTTYITNIALPQMAKLVDAEWLGKPEAGGSSAPRGGPHIGGGRPNGVGHEETPHTVEWSATDQQQLYKDYNWQKVPSELDVRYAQEEMWVMKAIFETIAAANKKGEVVREIDQTLIGYNATNKFPLGEGENRIIHFSKQGGPAAGGFTPMSGAPNMLGQAGAGAAPLLEPKRPVRDEGEAGGPGGAAPMFDRPQFSGGGPVPPMIGGGPPGMNGQPGGAAPGAPDPDARLKDGRYVDAKGKPLTAADLQNPTEYHLLAFKIRLVANQAQFQKVIEEFSNSELPLEIREVRINPPLGQSADMEGQHDGRRSHAAKPGAVIHNVTLEIDGVAYLLNPPDPKTVGLPDAPATAAAAPATATGTPPAATTPASTTPPATTPAPATPPVTTPAAAAPVATPPTGVPAGTPPTTPPAATPPAPITTTAPPAATLATPAAPAGGTTAPK